LERIVITGGTGFIGLSLAKHISDRGLLPVLVGRNVPKTKINFEFIKWDAIHAGDWINSIDGAFGIVNLAGRSVDCIKSPDNCDEILRSRLDSTKVIGQALKEVANPPKVWLQMSTTHIYGDPPTQVCTESSGTGYGLAPFVGKAWEETLLESMPAGMREVRLRTSFVLGSNGGALKKLVRVTRLGFGGRVGHGRQGMSWIHQDDLNEIIYQAIVNSNYQGIYNASSPNPVSNNEFMKAIRASLNIPFGLPAPEWIARVGARLFFNTDPELALYGRYVKSERLEREGFVFKYSRIDEALQDLFSKTHTVRV